MKVLNNEEMLNVVGGASLIKRGWTVVLAGASFVIGLIGGLINPAKCN